MSVLMNTAEYLSIIENIKIEETGYSEICKI